MDSKKILPFWSAVRSPNMSFLYHAVWFIGSTDLSVPSAKAPHHSPSFGNTIVSFSAFTITYRLTRPKLVPNDVFVASPSLFQAPSCEFFLYPREDTFLGSRK